MLTKGDGVTTKSARVGAMRPLPPAPKMRSRMDQRTSLTTLFAGIKLDLHDPVFARGAGQKFSSFPIDGCGPQIVARAAVGSAPRYMPVEQLPVLAKDVDLIQSGANTRLH